MAQRFTERDLNRLPIKSIFFDTNVLLNLFGGVYFQKQRMRDYASLYKNLRVKQTEVVIDITVVSEFVNRCLRMQYHAYLKNTRKKEESYPFKKSRNSKQGKKVSAGIY